LCRRLAERAGLDFNHARLDRSLHPFCGGTPTDVRITMRYDETDPVQAMMAVLHETGHALYEKGLPAEWARQPVGQASGMAVHESQSLILECKPADPIRFSAGCRRSWSPPSRVLVPPGRPPTSRGYGGVWSVASSGLTPMK
jgi:Zn-dependent M32 family carboxypeptidase